MNRSGLPALARGVRSYFTTNTVPATVALGLKGRSFQLNQGPGGAMRVVLIPGMWNGVAGGQVLDYGSFDRDGPQNYVGTDPSMRTLGWDHSNITVSIWAVDGSKPTDPEAQIEAIEALREVTIQAIHSAVDPATGLPVGFANIEWGRKLWNALEIESSFGQEMLQYLVLHGPVFDQPVPLVHPDGSVLRSPSA